MHNKIYRLNSCLCTRKLFCRETTEYKILKRGNAYDCINRLAGIYDNKSCENVARVFTVNWLRISREYYILMHSMYGHNIVVPIKCITLEGGINNDEEMVSTGIGFCSSF